MQNEIPRTTGTRTTYSILLGWTRPHDTHTHTPKTQMKKKENGASLVASWAGPLVPVERKA